MQGQHTVEDAIGIGLKDARARGGLWINVLSQSLGAEWQQLLLLHHLTAGAHILHIGNVHTVVNVVDKAAAQQFGEIGELLHRAASAHVRYTLNLEAARLNLLNSLHNLLSNRYHSDYHILSILLAQILDRYEQLLEDVDIECSTQAVVASVGHKCHTLHFARLD